MRSVPGSVVRAATVLSPSGPLSPGEVVLDEGLIAEVRPATGAVEHEILAPGFIDLQMNGRGAVDVAEADGDDWDRLDAGLLAQGVTSWCPTLCSAPRAATEASLERMAAAAGRPGPARPALVGAHLEGPFLAVAGAHPPSSLEGSVDRAWLLSLPGVALVTLAPELPGALEAIEALVAEDVLVALGHSAADVDQVSRAAEAGAQLVTHLGNGMGPFSQRRPGILGAGLADDRLAVSVIADLVHVHPVLIKVAFRAKGPGRTVLVTDAVASGDEQDSEPPRLADGTLMGSVLTMDRSVANCVAAAGVSLAEAVAAASSTPAALLGLDDRGTLTPGRRADLVALGPDLRAERVWLAGAVAWSRARH